MTIRLGFAAGLIFAVLLTAGWVPAAVAFFFTVVLVAILVFILRFTSRES